MREGQKCRGIVICLLLLLCCGTISLNAQERKVGLLLIAHGSRSDEWNDAVREIGEQVSARMDTTLFAGAGVAFMEMSEPTIAMEVERMERDDYSRIIAVPLFMVPSGHFLFDIPAILGHYHDPHVVGHLREEGIEIVDSDIPVTITPTLSESEIAIGILVDRVKRLSVNPGEESIVFLVHGSDMFAPLWERFCARFAVAVCAATGISYCEWAQIGVGQRFETSGIPVIHEAAEHRERVILIGGYMALSARKIFDRYNAKKTSGGRLDAMEIIAADKAVLPDDRIVDWILQSASSALGD